MSSAKEAVAKTLRYAAFFRSQLNDSELHHWLISAKTYTPSYLKEHYPQKSHRYPPASSAKIRLAQKAARFLSFFPTIFLVALTGSLAVNNAKSSDDIDLMIVTKKDTLWLTRLFVIPLIDLFFRRRLPKISHLKSQIANTICMNLWLDESSLAVPLNKRNLYIAHEVLQVKPLLNRRQTYQKFILANAWTKNHLANAYGITIHNSRVSDEGSSSGVIRTRSSPEVKNFVKVLLKALNKLAFKLQYLYMKPKITQETITLHSAYFHPRNLAATLDKFLQP